MRKPIILLFILVFPITLYGQLAHKGYIIKEKDSTDVYFELPQTDSDTSEVYRNYPIVTVYYWFGGNDTINVTLNFQTSPDDTAWVTSKTVTVTTDSTWYEWKITESAIGSGPFYRIVQTGNSGNGLGVKSKLKYDGYERR